MLFVSTPPENIRKPEVFNVFRGYRERPLIWNGLMTGFYVFNKEALKCFSTKVVIWSLNFQIFKSHEKLLKFKDGHSEPFLQSFTCNQDLKANYEDNIGKLLPARTSLEICVLLKQVRSTHLEVFSKASVLKHLAKFIEKHLPKSLEFSKCASLG